MVIDAVEQEGLPSSEWSPFNMRQYNLSILKPPVGKSSSMGSSTTSGTNTTSSSNNNKASSMSYTSAAKSLDLLRQNLQRSINQEIKSVITKYIDLFAKPGIENIKNNLGPDSVTEDHIHNMCRQILEEAKRMYPVYSSSSPSSNSAIDPNDSDYQSSQNNSSTSDGVRLPLTSPMGIKRESDTDSEASSMSNASKKLKKSANNNKSGAGNPGGNNSTNNNSPNKPKKPAGPSRKHVASWDANKLTVETLFIMGAKANKALGFAQTRGRLYVKHPGLFKYASDSDDKEWLSKNKLMPATGGRAYIMLLEDIEKLAKDNKLNATINYDDIKGFRVPDFILTKMKSYIDSWKKQYAEEPKSASTTSTTTAATTTTTVSAKNRSNQQNNHNGNHHQQQQQHPTPPPQHHPPPPQQQLHHQNNIMPMSSMGGSNGTLTQLNPAPPPTLSLHSQGPPMQQQPQQQLSHSQANLSSYHLSGSSPGNIMYEPSLMPLNSAPPPQQSHDLAEMREYNIHMEKPPPMYPGHSNSQQQGPPQQQPPQPPPPPPQQQPHAMSQMQNPNPVAYQVHPPPNHLDPIEQALSKGDWSNVSDRSLLQYALQSSRNMGSWDPQDSFDLIDSVTNGSLVGGGGNMVVGENSPLLQISADAGAHLTAPPMGPVSPNCELSAVLDQAFQYTDT